MLVLLLLLLLLTLLLLPLLPWQPLAVAVLSGGRAAIALVEVEVRRRQHPRTRPREARRSEPAGPWMPGCSVPWARSLD